MTDSDNLNPSLNTLLASFTNIDPDSIGVRGDQVPIESICIDTSNTRIGINTLDPSYSIHIADSRDISGSFYASEITCISANITNLDISSIININTISGINLLFDVSKIDISGTIDLSNSFRPKFYIPDTSAAVEPNQLYYDVSGDSGILMIKIR
jgi:hypothetical protein